MITESTIYWITRLDSMKLWAGIGTEILLLIGIVGTLIVCYIINDNYNRDERGKNTHKAIKVGIIITILGTLLSLILVFIPSTKEMCAIKGIPLIVNDPNVQKLPSNVVDLANEWIEEAKPDNVLNKTK